MMDDYKIFRSAHEKNYDPLIELLRSSEELLPRHRELLAKILENKIKRPAHRKAGTLRDLRHRQAIFKRVVRLEIDGWKQGAAIAQVADEFRCSEGTVKGALKKGREKARFSDSFETALDEIDRIRGEDGLLDLETKLRNLMCKMYAEVGLKRWFKPRVYDEDNNLILF